VNPWPSEDLGRLAQERLPGAVTSFDVRYGQLALNVARERILDVLTMLRDGPEFQFQQLVDIAGVDYPDRSPRFEVVYVGSDLYRRAAKVDDERIRAERARWGLSPEDVVVGFMGRLVEEKGVEDVVAAVQEVHRTHPRVKLLVVGTGSHQQGDVEARVREAVAVKRLSYVRFAGYQADEALYYRLFDVFVLATRTGEPYATSVVQAMMAGKPVVGTATGGTPELVRDRETGMLVPPSEPRRMAAALRALLDEPGLAERVAAAGRDHVMANNREEVTTARVERLYDELARGR